MVRRKTPATNKATHKHRKEIIEHPQERVTALPGPDTQRQDSGRHRDPERTQAPPRTQHRTGANETGRRPRHTKKTATTRTKAREHSNTPSTRSPGAEPAPNRQARVQQAREEGKSKAPQRSEAGGGGRTEQERLSYNRRWRFTAESTSRPNCGGRTPGDRLALLFSRRPVVQLSEQAGGLCF